MILSLLGYHLWLVFKYVVTTVYMVMLQSLTLMLKSSISGNHIKHNIQSNYQKMHQQNVHLSCFNFYLILWKSTCLKVGHTKIHFKAKKRYV